MDFCSEYFNIEEDPSWNPVTYSDLKKKQKTDANLKKTFGT